MYGPMSCTTALGSLRGAATCKEHDSQHWTDSPCHANTTVYQVMKMEKKKRLSKE